jgi:hypothetical protein
MNEGEHDRYSASLSVVRSAEIILTLTFVILYGLGSNSDLALLLFFCLTITDTHWC